MSYYAFERGLMEEDIWLAWRTYMEREFAANPGMAELWAGAGPQYGDGFRSVVDGLLGEH